MGIHIKNKQFVIKVFLICLVLVDLLKDYNTLSTIDLIIFSNKILKPAILIFLISYSKNILNNRLNWGPTLGLLLSFAGVYLFKAFNVTYPLGIWISYYALGLFNSIFLLISFIYLGRNFSIFPSLHKITDSGPYSLVRHPIYAIYISFYFAFTLIYTSFLNLLGFVCLLSGLFIRIYYEEKVLENDQKYLEYKKAVKNRLLGWFTMLPVAPLIFFIFFYHYGYKKLQNKEIIDVVTASKLQELSPLKYDEWGTIFIGNHIFPRLIPNKDRNEIEAISSEYTNKCLMEENKVCTKHKLVFKIKAFKSCSGLEMTAQIFKRELKSILEEKNWILSDWGFCESSHADEICIIASGVRDIERRLDSIYLRFGWSISDSKDRLFGLYPYCLRKNSTLDDLTLIPQKKNIPIINFKVDLTGSENFDLSLYEINKKKYGKRNLITHTPAAYYLVMNKKFEGSEELFLGDELVGILNKNLSLKELNVGLDSTFDVLVPKGNIFSNKNEKIFSKFKSKTFNFVIPNFIKNCNQIKESLDIFFTAKKLLNINVMCVDIAEYIPNNVLKGNEWDVFLTPLTPGGPFIGALSEQYFSKSSKDAWIGRTKESFFRRVAVIVTAVTTSNEICFIKPNPLGIGDMFITDLTYCDSLNE